MSFLATANPPAQGTEQAVTNDGFFPAVDCEALRTDIRLDGTVTAARLKLAEYPPAGTLPISRSSRPTISVLATALR